MSSNRPSAGPIARYAPSSTLRAMPAAVVGRRAEEPFGAPFAIQPPRRISSVSRAPLGAADQLGPRPHRNSDSLGVRVSRAAARLRVVAKVGTPQPSTPTVPCGSTRSGDLLLQRMGRVAVGMQRPAVCAARGEHPRVLARAVVAKLPVGPALLRPVLEVVDLDPGAGEHLARGGQLGGLGAMGGTGDRELVVVEVVVALEERDRLDRLRRRAQVEGELGVAVALAVGRRDVHAMHRLDHPAPRHVNDDRFHYIRKLSASTSSTNGLVTLYGPYSRTARSPWYQPASARLSLPPKTCSRWRR